jgi:large subunit ribosomal protein L21
MFAVLKTGGKQYKVQKGDVLRIEKIAADAGETVQFNDILMLGGDTATVGTPLIEGAAVQAVVIDQIKGEKTINFVKRRRKHSSQRTKGHRQKLTLARVTDILSKGGNKSGVKSAVGKLISDSVPAPKAEGAQEAAPKSKPSPAVASRDGDDLTQLSGVGPALLKRLNTAGITKFAQIAAWTDVEATKFDEKLSLKSRIEREGWIEQAKKLASKS